MCVVLSLVLTTSLLSLVALFFNTFEITHDFDLLEDRCDPEKMLNIFRPQDPPDFESDEKQWKAVRFIFPSQGCRYIPVSKNPFFFAGFPGFLTENRDYFVLSAPNSRFLEKQVARVSESYYQ